MKLDSYGLSWCFMLTRSNNVVKDQHETILTKKRIQHENHPWKAIVLLFHVDLLEGNSTHKPFQWLKRSDFCHAFKTEHSRNFLSLFVSKVSLITSILAASKVGGLGGSSPGRAELQPSLQSPAWMMRTAAWWRWGYGGFLSHIPGGSSFGDILRFLDTFYLEVSVSSD